MNDIYSIFKRSFNLIEADTPELLLKVYQLRYLVLCVQNNFPDMNASDFPDELEKDEFDERSSHMLIQFIPTGKFIGTVRLILPDPSNPGSLFPLEMYTQIDPSLYSLDSETRKQTAEISRFLVSSDFDRRKRDRRKSTEHNNQQNSTETNQTAGNHFENDRRKGEDRRRRDRRSSLNLYVVLMAGVVKMTSKHNMQYWISAMEPALNRLVSFSGLNFNPIGPVIDYHGRRQPYSAKVFDILHRTYKFHTGVWEVITDRGKYSYGETNIKE